MSDLERLRAWLQGYAPLADGWAVDFTHEVPDSGGIFPKGCEQVRIRSTVVGGTQVLCRFNFSVYRTFAKPDGFVRTFGGSEWLMGLSAWVEAECAAGRVPRFGNTERPERAWCHSGAYHSRPEAGVGLYGAVISVEFWRKYGG